MQEIPYAETSSRRCDLPIVIGHIRLLDESTATINAAIDRIAAADPLIAAVPSSDLTFESATDVHFNLARSHALGKRLAEAYIRLAGKSSAFHRSEPSTLSHRPSSFLRQSFDIPGSRDDVSQPGNVLPPTKLTQIRSMVPRSSFAMGDFCESCGQSNRTGQGVDRLFLRVWGWYSPVSDCDRCGNWQKKTPDPLQPRGIPKADASGTPVCWRY